jgi:hypothetical protein
MDGIYEWQPQKPALLAGSALDSWFKKAFDGTQLSASKMRAKMLVGT